MFASLKIKKSADVPPTLNMAGLRALAMLTIRGAVKLMELQLERMSPASRVTDKNCGSTTEMGAVKSTRRTLLQETGLKGGSGLPRNWREEWKFVR